MRRRRATDFTTAQAPGPHGPVPLRVYAGTLGTALLWCHGGAFTSGDLAMPEAHGVATVLAHEAGVTVVTVDYRLAGPAGTAGSRGRPVRWPIPSDDVLAAWAWLQEQAPEIGTRGVHLGGASAGGNLAAGAALRLRGGSHEPRSLLLAYPTLHAVQPDPDPQLAEALAALPPEQRWEPPAVAGMYADLLGSAASASLTQAPLEAVPGAATPDQLVGLPPTLVLLSEVDGLRPSGEAFVQALGEADVPVRREVEPGTLHGHLNTPELPGAAASLGRMAGWLSGGWAATR